MAPAKKSSKSSSSSPSSSALAATSKQEDPNTTRRTTRAMKAKQQEAAAAAAVTENQESDKVAQKVKSNSANTSQSSTKPNSRSRKQATKTMQATQVSGDTTETTHETQTMSTNTKTSAASVLGKRKSSSSEDNEPQQANASKKAKTQAASTSAKIASASVLGKRKSSSSEDNEPQQTSASKKAKTQDNEPVKSDKQASEPVSTTAHLITNHFPSGKVRVKSNSKPQPLQAVIDAELEMWLKKTAKEPFHFATQVEPVSNIDMQDDFKAMGFGSAQIDSMMSRRESILVDGTAQRPSAGYGKYVENTGPVEEKKKRKTSARGKHTDLFIFADQEWVLFDPVKGYPPGYGQPPPSMTKWETYLPGNPRILLHNPKKKSIRSQATPKELLNVTVNYTELGPKITGWEPIGTVKAPPPPPPEPEPEEPPALGRGARRKTSATKKRESDEISVAKPEISPPVPKKAAPEHVVADEKLIGEGKQKRKRRPGKPKISAATVVDSNSEGKE